mgnify:CR=1 FL=1
MGLTMLLGGARSGKSSLAVAMARSWSGHVSVVATAQAGDAEMESRIRRHRDERPWDWTVIEEPLLLPEAMASVNDPSLLIIDCLTLWVSNLVGSGMSDESILELAARTASLAAERDAPVIVVSNEVGSGIVPVNELARRYRDLLGSVNAVWASSADDTFLVVAGRLLRLESAAGLAPVGHVV